jgi:acyl-CoA dehydrogenase
VLLACEGAASGAGGQDARRLLLSRLVLDHRVLPHDPMDTHDNGFDVNVANILLSDEPVSLREALQVLAI